MLEIRRIREDEDAVRSNLERRGQPELLGLLDEVKRTDSLWRDLLQELEELRPTPFFVGAL